MRESRAEPNVEPVRDGRKDALLAQIGDDQRNLPEPGRRRGHRLRRGLDTHRDLGDTRPVSLLVGNCFVLPHQGGIFLGWFATGSISLRNSWEKAPAEAAQANRQILESFSPFHSQIT